tara:strand:+ start:910 stop:1551 length:642 start_codon:yes stop_codon:yes gene_type:complete
MAEFTIYPEFDGTLRALTWDGTSMQNAHDRLRAGDDNLQEHTTNGTLEASYTLIDNSGEGYGFIYRPYLKFDTSVLSGEEPVSVDLVLTTQDVNNAPHGQYVVAFNPTTTTQPVGTDEYDNYGSTSFAYYSITSIADTEYTISLNQGGIDEVDPSGDTFYGIRHWRDFTDSCPTVDTGTDNDYYASEQAGTDKDPHLVVTTADGGGTGFMAMF